MSFKVSSKFTDCASIVNGILPDKFPLLLNRIIQKLHLRNVRFFTIEEEKQLQSLFSLEEEQLKLILNCCSYIFEQAAFTTTGPESLYEILLEAGFDETHAKILGKLWATEGAGFVGSLKSSQSSIGFDALVGSDYQLNMVLGQSGLTRQHETTTSLNLTVHKKARQTTASLTGKDPDVSSDASNKSSQKEVRSPL